MVEPMEITPAMKEAHRNRIDEIIKKQNETIKKQVGYGNHSAVFWLDKDDPDYAEVRERFEKSGYHIKPTGYIGGVWQLSEDICW